MRIGVMGAGSIGCYIGGRIVAADAAEVVFVGRQRLRDQITTHGLTPVQMDRRFPIPPESVRYETDPAVLAKCELILFCLKSGQTRELAERLDSILRPGAMVVSLQNGLRNAPTLRDVLGERTVIASVVGFNVVSKGEGVFHNGMSGPIQLEATHAKEIGSVFRNAGLATELHVDLAPHQWTKLLVNLNNAVSALSGAPTVELLKSPGYRKIVAAIIEEALMVLKAAGIKAASLRGVPVGIMPTILRLPTPLVRLVTRAQMKVDPEARSSMWEDLQRKRATEVDFLNGEIVELAKRHGTHAPLNERIVRLVQSAEDAKIGSPNINADELWAALRT